ncbi:MAG: OmpH family outer membrane protein [Alphaproteobacteria bacterium]|nr:OmpH family outer membrane protein [Alphaproteobacteria bacterium]
MSNEKVNYGLVVLVAVVASVISSLVTYKAVSADKMKFAVVDVNRVVLSSKEIAALSAERQSQVQELKKMADEANIRITAEKDAEAKKALSEKALATINAKKETFDKVHASGLQAADKKINDVITAIADKEGLDIVFNKASLVNGGVDITDSVVEQVR